MAMTREEALISLVKWQRKNPNKTDIRKAYAALGDDVTLSRFVKVKGEPRRRKARGGQLWFLNMRHKALTAKTTLFPTKVVHPTTKPTMLVSGHSNIKIGRDVRKGRLFRGYWIYTLTLEERATCPNTCHHWETCYGNNMPWATRLMHGPELMRRLETELAKLLRPQRGAGARFKKKGVLLRLHALGDFYSVEYVAFWDAMLKLHPQLAIYGYTARQPGDPIHDAIARVKKIHGRRFAVRWSDGPGQDSTQSIREESELRPDAFICPEQTGKTTACATCGLCWNSTKPVAFLEH